MKTHSGGGRTPVEVGVKGGSPRTNVISQGEAGQIGAVRGAQRAIQPLVAGTAKAPVQLGNAKATDVAGGGPGKGRTVLPSGGQGQHGSADPGMARPSAKAWYEDWPGGKR